MRQDPNCAYFHCGTMGAYSAGAKCGQCAGDGLALLQQTADPPQGMLDNRNGFISHPFEADKARTSHLKS